ncbi:MAG: hypothetical protein GF330_09050 [Candidatus Eisenbacteria bacterium]|nr:hypothetical protein [Candidatus Eisenbacteria bacterium]
MPQVVPSRERAHLLLAAIRVAAHRQGRPPTPAQAAELLDWTVEETLALLRGLGDGGIVQLHETPFEVRVEIRDHLRVEELPAEAEKAELQGEVDDFKRRSQKRREEIDRMFTSGESDQKRKQAVDDLAEEFEKFRRKGRRRPE